MEISKTHVWREIMAPLLPVISSLSVFFFSCSLELCGCLAFNSLACVIRRLWFGKSPKCHDVYFKQRAVDFHSFTSLVVFSWRWTDSHFASYPRLNSRSLLSSLKYHEGSGEEGANLQFTLYPKLCLPNKEGSVLCFLWVLRRELTSYSKGSLRFS